MIALGDGGAVLSSFVRDLDSQERRPRGLRPELSGCSDDDIAAARLAWATRIVDEYRSVVVFSELLRLLGEAEAPYAALCTVQRLIGDELRHTRLCAEAVGWFGGFDGLDVNLAGIGLPPRPRRQSPAARALLIVARELVVAEVESVTALRAYRDATSDPAVHSLFDVLLRDEARHAAAGRRLYTLLQAALPEASTRRVRRELPDIIARDRDDIRAAYRASATGGPGRALGATIELGDLTALR